MVQQPSACPAFVEHSDERPRHQAMQQDTSQEPAAPTLRPAASTRGTIAHAMTSLTPTFSSPSPRTTSTTSSKIPDFSTRPRPRGPHRQCPASPTTTGPRIRPKRSAADQQARTAAAPSARGSRCCSTTNTLPSIRRTAAPHKLFRSERTRSRVSVCPFGLMPQDHDRHCIAAKARCTMAKIKASNSVPSVSRSQARTTSRAHSNFRHVSDTILPPLPSGRSRSASGHRLA